MRIHTRTVWDLATGEKLEDESYEYEGPVAEAKGGSSKTQNVTQTNKLDPAISYQAGGLASDIFNYARQPTTFYPGSTVAQFSPEETAAYNQIHGLSMSSPYLNQAQQYASDVAGGKYINEGLNQAVSSAVQALKPAINSQFGLAGRTGGQLGDVELAKAISSQLAPVYMRERELQQQAAGQLPALEAAKYADPQAAIAAQQALRGQEQANIDEAVARHQFGQNAQMERAMQALASITSGYSGTGVSSQQTPYSRNPVSGALGGGLSGLALGAAVPGLQPYMWPIAAAGALGGYFG